MFSKIRKRKAPPGTIEDKEGQVRLLSNAPTSANITSSKYTELLADAVGQQGVYNIALMGGYCTGKSSILEDFRDQYGKRRGRKSERAKYKIKEISFLTLEHEDSSNQQPSSDQQPNPNQQPSSQQLQKEIVSQLYYEMRPRLFNRSGFTRINPIVSYAAGLLISFLLLSWRFPTIKQLFQNPSLPDLILELLLELGSAFLVFVLTANILTKVNFRRLGFGSINLELGDRLPNFEQLLDELINIFRTSKHDVVIFEDLDRFNNIKIFEDLRQLNYKLNHAEQIKRPVKFIYAIKDSLIADGASRNKIFDQVIPVVPFTSPDNIEWFLQQQLAVAGIKINNAQLRRIIARSLREARQVNAFVNAAATHLAYICRGQERLNWIDEDEVVAIAFIRQLWPKEYEALQHGNSDIDQIYDFGVKKKKANLEKIRKELDEAQKDGDQDAILEKRKTYRLERDKTTWAIVERHLDDEEGRGEIKEVLLPRRKDPDDFLDTVQRLIAAGALSDSFRACIAPYRGNQVSKTALNFINNSLQRGNTPEYYIELTVPEIQEITRGRTKYDFDSVAFLNCSFIDAVVEGKIEQVTLQGFLEGQRHNLTELILFHDAYAHYCAEKPEQTRGIAITRLQKFVSMLLQLYPKDLIGHALISGLLDPDWPIYKYTNKLFFKVMSDTNLQLPHDIDKQQFIDAVNQIYRIDPESIKNIIAANHLLFDDIDRLDEQPLVDFIVDNKLFVVNARNLAQIPDKVELSGMLVEQRPDVDTLKVILSHSSDISTLQISAVLNYVFQLQDYGVFGRNIAQAVVAKSISLPEERIKMLIPYIKDNALAVKIILLAELEEGAFVETLSLLGEPYSKLLEHNKRPSFPDDGPHKEMAQRLEGWGRVTRIAGGKSNRIVVRVR